MKRDPFCGALLSGAPAAVSGGGKYEAICSREPSSRSGPSSTASADPAPTPSAFTAGRIAEMTVLWRPLPEAIAVRDRLVSAAEARTSAAAG